MSSSGKLPQIVMSVGNLSPHACEWINLRRTTSTQQATSSELQCVHIRPHRERDIRVAKPRSEQRDRHALQVHKRGASMAGIVPTPLRHLDLLAADCHIVHTVDGCYSSPSSLKTT